MSLLDLEEILDRFHSNVMVSVVLRSVAINLEEFLDRVNIDIAM